MELLPRDSLKKQLYHILDMRKVGIPSGGVRQFLDCWMRYLYKYTPEDDAEILKVWLNELIDEYYKEDNTDA